jgi:hypothetical protein
LAFDEKQCRKQALLEPMASGQALTP